MHLVLVSAQHDPSHGGIGAYVRQLAHACSLAKWRVELITRPGRFHSLSGVDKVHQVATRDMNADFESWVEPLRRIEKIRPYRYGLWSLAVAEALLKIEGEPDVIEFVDAQAEGFVSLTSHSVRMRFANTVFVVSSHTPMWLHESNAGEDPQRFGRAMYHAWEREAMAAADGIVFPSRKLQKKIQPTNPSLIAPLPVRTQDAFAPSNSKMILFIGAVQPQKGVDTWAQSLNRVLKAQPQAHAVMIGPDTPTAPDGLSMVAHVQQRIDPRLMSRFRWTGALPQEQVLEFLREAALAVVPSVFESFSYVAAQAIMCGRPLIVTDQVGITEWAPGVMQISIGDAEALAEAQLQVLGALDAAHARALEIREQLLQASDPLRTMRLREAFVHSLPKGGVTRFGESDTDSIERMSQWLRGIESQVERSESGQWHSSVLVGTDRR